MLALGAPGAAIRRGIARGTRPAIGRRVPLHALALVVASAVVAAAGCRRAGGDAHVTAEAEERAGEATLTSGVLDTPGADVDPHARDERADYRARLEAALDALDARRPDAVRRGAAYVAALEGRRDVLKSDLEALDRATDLDWAALRARVDRDLRADRRDQEGR